MAVVADEYLLRKNYLTIEFEHRSTAHEEKILFINNKRCSLTIDSGKISPRTSNINVTYTIKFKEPNQWTKNELKLFIIATCSSSNHIFKMKAVRPNDLEFEASETFNGHYEAVIKATLFYESDISQISLLKNMSQLYADKSHSDLKLIVEDKQFDVHKNILVTRSNVFAKMIETDMQEKEKSEITLHGQNVCAVEELLSFIYTNKLNVERVPCELFKLAHFLDMPILQNLCKNFLKSHVNLKYLTGIVELTNQSQYGLQDLRTDAKSFITNNKKIFKIDTFKEFFLDNPMILLELLE